MGQDQRSNATASRYRSCSRHNRQLRLRPNLVILAHPKVEARLCDPVLGAVLNVDDVTKYIAGEIRLRNFSLRSSATLSVYPDNSQPFPGNNQPGGVTNRPKGFIIMRNWERANVESKVHLITN
jgi:hypothetical protein